MVMPETKRWQHELWGAIGDCEEPRRDELVIVRELEQWRSAPASRVGID